MIQIQTEQKFNSNTLFIEYFRTLELQKERNIDVIWAFCMLYGILKSIFNTLPYMLEF